MGWLKDSLKEVKETAECVAGAVGDMAKETVSDIADITSSAAKAVKDKAVKDKVKPEEEE